MPSKSPAKAAAAGSAQNQEKQCSLPDARVTVQSEIESIFNALVTTGAEIEALENTLLPIAHDGGGAPGQCGGTEPPPQPQVIDSLRGLLSGVESYNIRLLSLRHRLAL